MGVYCLDMYTMLVSTDVALRRRIPVAWVEAAGAGSLTGREEELCKQRV